MTDPYTFRRLALAVQEEEVLLPPPHLPQGQSRDKILASFLRELFTQPGGSLEARAGAVLLDEDDRPRGLTAPFGQEWPRAGVQALELFATARMTGWPRLVLFRLDPNPHSVAEIVLEFAQEMRALGVLFGVDVMDLLIVRPKHHWTLSKVALLGASLNCEATLSRSLDYLIACGFERSLPPLVVEDSAEGGVPLRAEHLVGAPRSEHGLEGV